MRIDRDRFMDQGFLVVPEIIPADKLEAIRASCEKILERQKIVWARERRPGDPAGGQWETARQPRVRMELPGLIDEETANVVEDFWIADQTLNICKQILCNPEPMVTSMMMMCSPVRDHPGGTGWHRDVHPIDMAPLEALQGDFMENGPRYIQWNVPLHDDKVLWVVPGSHRRVNTKQENADLLVDTKQPVTGGVPVELRAGDGVIYSNFLIHWGSNYTTKLRRTLHGGHAIYGQYPHLGFAHSLAPSARQIFEGWARRSTEMEALTEATLRAVVDGDAARYRAALDALQPGIGPSGKTVLTIYLSKAANQLRVLKVPDVEVTEDARAKALRSHPITLNWGPEFADRFSDEEVRILWSRFEQLDGQLQDDRELFEPGFQSAPMHYYFNELPASVDTDTFIESWV